MQFEPSTALAHPNIAFIKYWGNKDELLRLPANGSISMNLEELFTSTTVIFETRLKTDQLWINGTSERGEALARVSKFLDIIRELAQQEIFASVRSENNFPSDAGIASSSSAFAALALAASKAIGLDLSEKDLSRLARRGSGSASRSVPSGFVEWLPGSCNEDSFAYSFAKPDHWLLVDCIVLLESGKKSVSSTSGHALANTSPIQSTRIADAPRRLTICKQAILNHDFSAFAEIVEQDSNLMHAVMMTSQPPIYYLTPGSLKVMKKVVDWRRNGLPVCFTIDAGANVHCICPEENKDIVLKRLSGLKEVNEIIVSGVGTGAQIVA
jgi:diphosphomevalonate decarboxylase